MKFKKGTKVTHKLNHRWSAVIIEDLEPRRHVNGRVRLRTTNPISATNSRGENLGRGYVMDFPKSLLKKVTG
jgi:hypothetical protein